MGLLGISRELQFRVCKRGKTQAKYPQGKGKSMFLYRGKRGWEGYSKHRIHGCSLTELLPGKKSSSSRALLSSQGVGAPSSGLLTLFYRGFCLLVFYSPLYLPICVTLGNLLYFSESQTAHL